SLSGHSDEALHADLRLRASDRLVRARLRAAGRQQADTAERRVRRPGAPAVSVARSTRLARRLLSDDVPEVLHVVRELVLLDRAEAGAREVFARLLLAPHRAEPFAALRERHGHAVHARDRVEQSADRMLRIPVNVAGAADLLH